MKMASKKSHSKSNAPKKKTRQGDGKFTKRPHNKKSKLYKKPYRKQGR